MRTPAGHRPRALFVGLATVDVTYPVDEIPRRNQKISVPAQHVSAGGPATNAAATFAFLGGRASLVTAAGSHLLATIIRRDLESARVQLHDVARRRREIPPVSSIMVLRRTGERTVVSANAAVFADIGAKFDPRWLAGVDIVQVDGHYMRLCIAVARAARRRGVPVVLDSGSWKQGMDELLPFVDMAVCSEDYRPPGCNDVGEVMDFLASRKIRCAAITRGARGIRFVDGTRSGRVSVEKVRAVDTLGAGDIFHGAFCYYLCLTGYGFRDALAAAAKVAAFSCRFPGTRQWMQKFRRRRSAGG